MNAQPPPMLNPNPSPSRWTAIRAWSVVARGAEVYDRRRMLPRLLPVTPEECAQADPQTTEHLVKLLAWAIRIERGKGRAGHWSYDLNRHLGLLQAYQAERRALRAGRRPARHEKGAAK